MMTPCPKQIGAIRLKTLRVVCGQQQQQLFPRPYTLHKKENNGLLTLNSIPVRPNALVTPNGDPYNEAPFESTIPIFQCAENTVSFRDDVLRKIDVHSCKWVVSRNQKTNEVVFSTRTRLLDAFDTNVQNTVPVPFQFQGNDVMEKLILHSVAILIVDIISFDPTLKKLNIEGRLWAPPSNVELDFGYVVKLYNDIFYTDSESESE